VKVGNWKEQQGVDAGGIWLRYGNGVALRGDARRERGEDLRHAAVVRSMRKIGEAKVTAKLLQLGMRMFPLPKEWKRENLRAVAFVQEKKSRRILGAAEIRIAQEKIIQREKFSFDKICVSS